MTNARTTAATIATAIIAIAIWQGPYAPPNEASATAHAPSPSMVHSTTAPVIPEGGDATEDAESAQRQPEGITVIGGTTEQRKSVEWAAAHFTDAGLELPGMVIEIHTSDQGCDGYDGVFRSREWRLDVCNPHRLIILHELAHAWERDALQDAVRHEFMELRGLASWNDSAVEWKERAVEDLAEVVVWGLRSHNGAATPHDPDRQAAFELVTGLDLPAGQKDAKLMSDVRHIRDRAEADPAWDVLR